MNPVSLFSSYAHYNQWMNEKIYSAATQLTAQELALERGAFFGSIIGTMNHLIVADTLWLKRFTNHPAQFPALEPIIALEKPAALNQLIFSELKPLRERRELLDKIISALIDRITAQDLAHVLHYLNTQGVAAQKPFYKLLLHFFNHQTHHRGQISTLLFQAGVNIGVTDLLALVPDEL